MKGFLMKGSKRVTITNNPDDSQGRAILCGGMLGQKIRRGSANQTGGLARGK